MLIKTILSISLLLILLSMAAMIYRIAKGPSVPERLQALDALSIYIIAGVAIFSILKRSTAYFEVILLLGILSFIVTIAFSKFIERGVVIERDDH